MVDAADVYEAGAAATRLGVSASGLRRYAGLYEARYGPLPRKGDKDESPRLYPVEVLDRLAGAKGLLDEGRVGSIDEGLAVIEAGGELVNTRRRTGADGGTVTLSGDMARLMVEELRALRAEVAGLKDEVRVLQAVPGSESWWRATVLRTVRKARERVWGIAED